MDKMREEFETWYWGLYRDCHSLSINEVFSVDSFGVYALMMPRVAYEAWKASRAALSENHSPDTAKMVAPEGWQLVPVEPTIEMVQAATHSSVGFGTRAAYQAMLAAAPKPGVVE